MRFVVYGAGAVGASIGAELAAGGHEVVLVARGAHLDALREKGLVYHTPGGTRRLELPAVGHPQETPIGAGDVVLLCVKTQDTAAALAALGDGGARDAALVCAQNGVENERIASRVHPRVYAMTVWLPATFLEPGEIWNHSGGVAGLLDVGRYPRGEDETCRALSGALAGCGFSSRANPEIMRWKYSKLLTNVSVTPVAVCGPGADIRAIGVRCRAEAQHCYAAARIDFASEAEESERRDACGLRIDPVGGMARPAGSAWQSLERGIGSVETDYLNGEIVLLGRLHGVPTPWNAAVQRAARRMASLRLRPGAIGVAELERLATEATGGR